MSRRGTSIALGLKAIELTILPVSLMSFTLMKLFVATDGPRTPLF
jgi:hypothetical protein